MEYNTVYSNLLYPWRNSPCYIASLKSQNVPNSMRAVFASHEHSSNEHTHLIPLTKCVYELSICQMTNNGDVNTTSCFFTVPQTCTINLGNLSIYTSYTALPVESP